MKSDKDFQSCAERLKAVADPDRLRIVLTLFQGEKNVSQIAGELEVDIVKVSHHLGVLRHAAIVATERNGRFVTYRLNPDVLISDNGPGKERSIELGCCRVDLAGKRS